MNLIIRPHISPGVWRTYKQVCTVTWKFKDERQTRVGYSREPLSWPEFNAKKCFPWATINTKEGQWVWIILKRPSPRDLATREVISPKQMCTGYTARSRRRRVGEVKSSQFRGCVTHGKDGAMEFPHGGSDSRGLLKTLHKRKSQQLGMYHIHSMPTHNWPCTSQVTSSPFPFFFLAKYVNFYFVSGQEC